MLSFTYHYHKQETQSANNTSPKIHVSPSPLSSHQCDSFDSLLLEEPGELTVVNPIEDESTCISVTQGKYLNQIYLKVTFKYGYTLLIRLTLKSQILICAII